MTAGHLLLRFRQKFGRGLRVAYYRDVVRPRILHTSPVENTYDRTCELHVLTSWQDWLNLIWTLKSFYMASRRNYALCIHEDGSLSRQQLETLREHFPAARVISRVEANDTVLSTLAAFPRCRAFRESNHLSPKLFDFRHYLQSERMLLLDSDVLFFREPAELLRRIEDKNYCWNTVNRDIASAYTVDGKTVKAQSEVDLIEGFNSGLGLIHKDALRLEWMEEFLGLPGILDGHFWRIEQTLQALCSSRFGVELLPSEYDIRLQSRINRVACRHYVGAIRHLFYKEGISRLQKEQFLKRAA
jgi:hypothetical protein